MHFSFKHANPYKYDQNNNHNLEPTVVPVAKPQRFKYYNHSESLLSVPEVKIRQPQVEDAHYGLLSAQDSTTTSSDSSILPYAVPGYEPSAAIVQLIQRYIGPGIQPNPYARNSWELLKPFKNIVNLRYNRRRSSPEPKVLVDWRGDNHQLNNVQQKPSRMIMISRSTGKREQEWPIHPPFRVISNSTEDYSHLDSRKEMEDTMSIDPVLLQDHAYEVSTSASHSLSLYSNQASTSLKNTIASDSPVTLLRSAYDPNPSLSLGSSAMQIADSGPTIMNLSSYGSSPFRFSIPSSPVIPSSPPSTVSVPVSSPIAGSGSANRLPCFSSSRFSSIANSSPLRPVSRRARTSQKRRASSPAPDSDPPLCRPARESKRLRVSD
ncbi:hypothetical protein E1B28_011147 [Marasmius oreades]|uniref:Uncharacterized protein n=1 Tax=Marasmius oreades TaxID=181124 RepID=A0A9P7UP89_9AGAR|nr:uncharacterized protein E1B28_011147 [Marasmius oreades]KAG7089462.1 hypothetical protein E1B28_011147 [Marasmius oreades]